MAESSRSSSVVPVASVGAAGDTLQYSRKRERTRAGLIAAATRVLADDGVDGATIGKIAAAAGVVPGTIYHNFGSRDALIEETLDGLAYEIVDGVSQARAAGDDPAARVALAAAGLVERAVNDRLFASAFGRLARRLPELRGQLRQRLTDIVAEGVESGRFQVPSPNLGVVADALLGVAVSAALNAAEGEIGREYRTVVAHLCLTMLGVGQADAEHVAKEACAVIDSFQAEQAAES